MVNNVCVCGRVATRPRYLVTTAGAAIISFRVVSEPPRSCGVASASAAGSRSWFTVTAFHQLARNATVCLSRGDRVIVYGELTIRQCGEKAGSHSVAAEIVAEALGHDLRWESNATAGA